MNKLTNPWLRLLNLFIGTGQVPGLSAAGFVYTGFAMTGTHVGLPSLVCAYLLVTAVYWHDYSADGNRKMIRLLPRLFLLYPLGLVAMLLWNRSPVTLLFAAGLLALGVAYARVFKSACASVPGFKNLFVAAMWVLLLPNAALYEGVSWNLPLSVAAAFLFVTAFINVATCDIKDIRDDKANGIRTLAVALGPRKLVSLLDVLNTMSGVVLVVGVAFKLFIPAAWVLLLSLPYVFAYTRLAMRGGGADACTPYSSTVGPSGWRRWFLHSVAIDGQHVWCGLVTVLASLCRW